MLQSVSFYKFAIQPFESADERLHFDTGHNDWPVAELFTVPQRASIRKGKMLRGQCNANEHALSFVLEHRFGKPS